MDDAASASIGKLRRRYPPLFDGSLAGLSVEEAERAWADGKAAERMAAADARDPPTPDDEFDAALAAEIAELDHVSSM